MVAQVLIPEDTVVRIPILNPKKDDTLDNNMSASGKVNDDMVNQNNQQTKRTLAHNSNSSNNNNQKQQQQQQHTNALE